MKNTDLLALAKRVIFHPVETLHKANKIKNELPTFDDLDGTLRDRYGSD
jgi:hypothetical protein